MNNELLARIERLERAVQGIWASCSCLRKDLDQDDIDMPWNIPNCEPPACEGCGQMDCICQDCYEPPEEPGEHECDRECPEAPCVKCGEHGYREEPEENEEEINHE